MCNGPGSKKVVKVLWTHKYSTYSGLKFSSSSPLAAQGPVSSASPSSTHSHRDWGRTVGQCTNTYSQTQSWLSPQCKNLPPVHFHSAAADRHPCSEDAWCTCSGSLNPLTSSGRARSLQRSGRQNGSCPMFTSKRKKVFCFFEVTILFLSFLNVIRHVYTYLCIVLLV